MAKPDYGAAAEIRGTGDRLRQAGQFAEAVAAYRKSLDIDPSQSQVWYSAGCAETSRKEFAEAASCFLKALEIEPDWIEAKHNLGRACFELGGIEEAMALFREASAGSELSRGAIAVAIPGDPGSDHRAVLEGRRAWAERYLPAPRPRRLSSRGSKLRIGYLSSFFQHRNWMKPVWGLINRHDRARFEIHLFSDAPASRVTQGYCAQAGDQFHDITGLSNEAAAESIENSGIDILIDLNGYSAVRRLGLVALRPAPVVAGWFNVYATSGMAGYDYLIGDDESIPAQEEEFYCEKIVRVPGSCLTFEVGYPVPPVASPPCLTKGAISFGCLASQYKITAAVIDAWCRILREVPQSVLVLRNAALSSEGNSRFVHGLFKQRGISTERVLLRGRADHFRFLQTYDDIDIALDTFPYNGGTTTTEAIWQGVPVVTFAGDRWVSRTSASLLRAGDLGQFVGSGIEDYVSTAVRLGNSANTPEMLAELRVHVRSRLQQSAVCDTQMFARNMERLYTDLAG